MAPDRMYIVKSPPEDQPFSLSWLCIYLVFVVVHDVRDSLWICQEIYRLLQCKSLEAPEG